MWRLMRRFQMAGVNPTRKVRRKRPRFRVLTGAVARQIPACGQRRQDDICLVNRKAAQPRSLSGCQAQPGKVAILSRETRDCGEAPIEIETRHGFTVRRTARIGK